VVGQFAFSRHSQGPVQPGMAQQTATPADWLQFESFAHAAPGGTLTVPPVPEPPCPVVPPVATPLPPTPGPFVPAEPPIVPPAPAMPLPALPRASPPLPETI
jgi:hypothetical protein